MNSQAVRTDLVLTRRLADGTTELIPIGVAHEELALPGAEYSLIDRSVGFDAPSLLVAQRDGADLILRIDGEQVLVIDDFFTIQDVTFFPAPDLIGGGGPFSGERLTPESPTLAQSSGTVQTIWSAEPLASSQQEPDTARKSSVDDQEGGISPLVWVALGVGALGAAAGGGGGGGGGSAPVAAASGGTADTDPPGITSGSTADPIAENSGAGKVVYTATATDAGAVNWSLSGTDAAAFAIDSDSGAVSLIDNPDFETQASYSITVVATDSAGNSSSQALILSITDQDDVAPAITSGATAGTIDENSGADQVVYTAAADTAVSWSLTTGEDSGAFAIDAQTGVVTLRADPDFETQSAYAFTVVATDEAGNASEQRVVLSIGNLDEVAPTITSGATAGTIDENSGADQVVYTAAADTAVSWSLTTGEDSDAFAINAQTGAVTLRADPDFETQSDYAFTVVATDEAGNASEQRVVLSVGNLDEVAPTITSGGTASAIDENSGAGQVVYTVTSTDTGDIASGSTSYSLGSSGDADAFDIDPDSGAVTLSFNPDFEAQASYNFTVVATDAALNSSEQTVSLNINDVNESRPTILSDPTAAEIAENSGQDQVIYTAIADVDVTWRLAPGGDADVLRIDALSGAVTLDENPDFEAQSNYGFTVVARSANGLESEQTVTLNIGNLDEVAPAITSGGTAPDIDENSGAGQVVYTVTSTDNADISSGSTSYSLSNGGDADAFTMDADTGAVRLTANPDFESQASYDFTVIATDAAGNSSERGVSLAINDVDETVPSVVRVALTEAVGAQNGTLNIGDTARITVSMSTNIIVDTAGGTPRVALDIGGDTAFADFVSGGGTSSLVFEYVIQAGDNDSNGIRIRPDSIQANGGTLASATGIPADLDHGNVRNNPDFIVDTQAPSFSLSTPDDDDDDVALDVDIELQFSEDLAIGSGDIVISDGTDTRTIDVTDATQVSLDQDRIIIDLTNDLNPSRNYSVQVESGAVTDEAGNAFAGISDETTLNFGTEAAPVDTSIVVFDLVQGTSSNHSGRSFNNGVSYDIYIRVDSNDSALSSAGDGPGSWGRWDDVDNLGSDDRIILVGNGGPVTGRFANPVEQINFEADFIAWESNGANGLDAARFEGRSFVRITGGLFFPNIDELRLFDSSLGDDFFAIQNGNLSTRYLTSMPAGVLTSQGLV